MADLQTRSHKSVIGPAVWKVAELRSDQGWRHQLTAIQLAELREMARGQHARGDRPLRRSQAELSRSALSKTTIQVRDQLDEGRGLFLLSGLNVIDYSIQQLVTLCFGLAVQLDCVLVPQNANGDLIRFVTDRREVQLDCEQARGHQGRAEMQPHSDSSEIAGLLCVRSAKRGGSTFVCSSGAIHNQLLRCDAQHLLPLREGFYFDMSGKTAKGVSRVRLPVFAYRDQHVMCQFNKRRIEVGMSKVGVKLSSAEAAALDQMSEIARSRDFAIRFDLRPGDILFLNNNRVLHARDAYEDWCQPNRKRLIIRFWLKSQKGTSD